MRRALAVRLSRLLWAAVAVWIGVLVLAAFLPSRLVQDTSTAASSAKAPALPCGLSSWDEYLKITSEHKTSDAVVAEIAKRCKDSGKGGDNTTVTPAGENWLMRHKNALKDEARRPGYKKMRELFIAAELQQSFDARLAALRKIADLADTPLLHHRAQIEIAHTALRSGEERALEIADKAAKVAHEVAQSLPKAAAADAFLVDAELALRKRELRKSIDLVDRALEHDNDYLAAHILRLDLVVRASGGLSDAEKAHYLDLGFASAVFIRRLTTKSYVVDARSALAEHYAQSDVSALLTFLLSGLGDDREGAKRSLGEFLTQCTVERQCSSYVIERARGLMNAL
jgi:hypothetical protein